MKVDGFDWDAGNRENCTQHGLIWPLIESLFHGSPRVAPGIRHSSTEQRFIAVGRISTGRPVFVAFTLRHTNGQTLIRPISARYRLAEEDRRYEQVQDDPAPDHRR